MQMRNTYTMTDLKFRKLWLTIGFGMICLIVYFSLSRHMPIGSFSHSDKLQHILAYGAIMWWFSLLYPIKRQPLLAATFLLMGLILDYSQSFVGWRVFDMLDVIANGIGILLGWLLTKTPLGFTLARIERLLTQP